MAIKNESGSVLLQVLVTGAVLALIAASLLRMEMFRYQMGARGAAALAAKRAASGALANLLTHWNNNNMTCANVPASGYSCSPAAVASPGLCGCTCTPIAQTTPPTLPTIQTSGTLGACQLKIVTPDSP